jgi:hypothetical protein
MKSPSFDAGASDKRAHHSLIAQQAKPTSRQHKTEMSTNTTWTDQIKISRGVADRLRIRLDGHVLGVDGDEISNVFAAKTRSIAAHLKAREAHAAAVKAAKTVERHVEAEALAWVEAEMWAHQAVDSYDIWSREREAAKADPAATNFVTTDAADVAAYVAKYPSNPFEVAQLAFNAAYTARIVVRGQHSAAKVASDGAIAFWIANRQDSSAKEAAEIAAAALGRVALALAVAEDEFEKTKAAFAAADEEHNK